LNAYCGDVGLRAMRLLGGARHGLAQRGPHRRGGDARHAFDGRVLPTVCRNSVRPSPPTADCGVATRHFRSADRFLDIGRRTSSGVVVVSGRGGFPDCLPGARLPLEGSPGADQGEARPAIVGERANEALGESRRWLAAGAADGCSASRVVLAWRHMNAG
jgi:hypothetical protein